MKKLYFNFFVTKNEKNKTLSIKLYNSTRQLTARLDSQLTVPNSARLDSYLVNSNSTWLAKFLSETIPNTEYMHIFFNLFPLLFSLFLQKKSFQLYLCNCRPKLSKNLTFFNHYLSAKKCAMNLGREIFKSQFKSALQLLYLKVIKKSLTHSKTCMCIYTSLMSTSIIINYLMMTCQAQNNLLIVWYKYNTTNPFFFCCNIWYLVSLPFPFSN